MPTLSTDAGSLATLLMHSKVLALALADRDRLRFANDAFRQLLGRTDECVGMSIFDLFAESDRNRIGAALLLSGQQAAICVASVTHPDGGSVDVELRFDSIAEADTALVAIVARDVTDRIRTDAQLSLLAYSDPLTGLANRAMFADRLLQAALAARRAGGIFAVLMLDLDGFKSVNDRHGHDAGDLVLQRIGSRLLACLRDTDTVARLGGDEFAVLVPGLKTRATAAAVAHRLISVVRQPIAVGASAASVGASVGIAIFPEHANAVDDLVAAADVALYAAKRRGRGCFVWAAEAPPADVVPRPLIWNGGHVVGIPEMDEQHAALAARMNDLGRALRNGEEPDRLFQEVVGYTTSHFANEERLMQACEYPGIEAHRDMHRQLLGDLRSLRLRGEGVSVSLLLRYLQEWLLRHVDGADRDLADALHAHGGVP